MKQDRENQKEKKGSEPCIGCVNVWEPRKRQHVIIITMPRVATTLRDNDGVSKEQTKQEKAASSLFLID